MKIDLNNADKFIESLEDRFSDNNLTVKDLFFNIEDGRNEVQKLSPYLYKTMTYELSRNKDVLYDDFNRPLDEFLVKNSLTHFDDDSINNPELAGYSLLYDLMNTPLHDLRNKDAIIAFNLESKEMAKGDKGLLDLCQNGDYYKSLFEVCKDINEEFGKKSFGNLRLEDHKKFNIDRMMNRKDYYLESDLTETIDEYSTVSFVGAAAVATAYSTINILNATNWFTKVIDHIEFKDIVPPLVVGACIFATGVIHDFVKTRKEDQKIVKQDLKKLREVDLKNTENLENAVVHNLSMINKYLPEAVFDKDTVRDNFGDYANEMKSYFKEKTFFVTHNPLMVDKEKGIVRV